MFHKFYFLIIQRKYVLYTLLPHLSGEPITMRDLTGNIIWGGLFGLCMYGFGKYNSKKAEEDEL
ncbi:hypothetical protein IKE_05837 [Bacillus cereus VD196]|uniref:Phage protein n=1 Tax=Bacillus cereus VD196 TaxID=1053243 RepID=A0A9W5V5L1_BACCE|nr:hypothetical protein IKE_06316 [Bacillus cereus VD196]EOO61935.1 hypothetical protein IKE_05837 [Bacillus cereus VD196]